MHRQIGTQFKQLTTVSAQAIKYNTLLLAPAYRNVSSVPKNYKINAIFYNSKAVVMLQLIKTTVINARASSTV